MFYGPSGWDPVMIVTQMFVLQCSFYTVVGIWIALMSYVMGSDLTLAGVLDPNHLDAWSPNSWPSILSFLLVAPASGYFLSVVVGRAKKCLDFGASVYFWHLVLCSLYGGFPSCWEWWVVNLCSLIVAVVLGEFLSWKKEMADIPRTDEPESMEMGTLNRDSADRNSSS
mmetsp:Transcript_3447/g.6537  ORF Transcript_3447/g.6537 Transcript_3447/m.6537 type:complete len:169 (+) Transcript_3447:88-594(+)